MKFRFSEFIVVFCESVPPKYTVPDIISKALSTETKPVDDDVTTICPLASVASKPVVNCGKRIPLELRTDVVSPFELNPHWPFPAKNQPVSKSPSKFKAGEENVDPLLKIDFLLESHNGLKPLDFISISPPKPL